MPPIVLDLREVFAERNLFLLATLGLISAAQGFRELAIRFGNASANGERIEASEPEDEAVLHLLLGVASFSERALTVLSHVRAAAEAEEGRNDSSPDGIAVITLRGLLG